VVTITPNNTRQLFPQQALFLDGVYVYRGDRSPRFQRLKAPVKDELEDLVQLISQRVGRCLERQGLLEQDTESAWLELDPTDEADATPIKRGGPLDSVAIACWSS
jgi:hypothetical protein